MISLKTADSALKNVYLEVLKNQFDYNVTHFLVKLRKQATIFRAERFAK